MRRERTYWICQLLGWGGFSAANLMLVAFVDRFAWSIVVSFTALSAAGVGCTHLLRRHIQRHGWVSLPLKPLLPRALGASLAIGCGLAAINYLFEVLIAPNPELPNDVGARVGIAAFLVLFWSGIAFGWQLIYFGAHYLESLERVEAEKWHLQLRVKEAELKALKSQLDPHFMFNSLNSIRALVSDDPDGAKRMVTQLASLLRYSLQTAGEATVPLERELQTVRTYLDLESIRLEERLRYTIDVDDRCLDIRVPPMVVQTLVENGIKHGVAALTRGGEIRVSSWLSNGNLHIKVINTGRLRGDRPTSGVGLRNAIERMRLLYGDTASLNLSDSSSGTVTAEIELPAAAAGLPGADADEPRAPATDEPSAAATGQPLAAVADKEPPA